MGKDASANAVRSVVLGPSAGVGMVGDVLGTKGSHVVIGDGAGNNINGQQNIAIGYKTGNDVKSDHNVAIGSEAGTNIGSSGNTSEGKMFPLAIMPIKTILLYRGSSLRL